jgi:uroporphyrinogen-III synthase
MSGLRDKPLAGATVVITRPVGHGRALARQVEARGGQALLLPGLSLRAATGLAQADVRAALASDWVIFTSPAAVRFAAALTPTPLPACATAAVGTGTARVLACHGVKRVVVPHASHDSEGLLAHPALQDLDGRQVSIVGAPGGRGLLQAALRKRGAEVRELHVYRRVPARLDRRHRDALRRLHGRGYMLLSSSQTLECLRAGLGPHDWPRVLATSAIVSSERIAAAARVAGFACVSVAGAPAGAALLAQAAALHHRLTER